ncbi:MAG: hypothetical protein A2233_00005 [Candidatus Kerfeldbacteria bacterium RIFOXYA2_FULL_38_24]|uniref:DUF1570 domain-containing protein n=1 Tax=Candidatus Kerfeldbacteria bacterium RIFOXYB2_FULL_38_14 TaxID=1798547 RepID=A0A1G2BCP1_9BACT|nr:MAG: hypothetical protein A2233_00005 [Candidatus Kerfeldbacteria bacterium RIFOXYA2_FULL_38_24]OGY85977.1 MAG: hypothetical protein A2319_00210 [Candidatus Kerfeldbacteria bacterium RIFOXYB2_FULL_38_14]
MTVKGKNRKIIPSLAAALILPACSSIEVCELSDQERQEVERQTQVIEGFGLTMADQFIQEIQAKKSMDFFSPRGFSATSDDVVDVVEDALATVRSYVAQGLVYGFYPSSIDDPAVEGAQAFVNERVFSSDYIAINLDRFSSLTPGNLAHEAIHLNDDSLHSKQYDYGHSEEVFDCIRYSEEQIQAILEHEDFAYFTSFLFALGDRAYHFIKDDQALYTKNADKLITNPVNTPQIVYDTLIKAWNIDNEGLIQWAEAVANGMYIDATGYQYLQISPERMVEIMEDSGVLEYRKEMALQEAADFAVQFPDEAIVTVEEQAELDEETLPVSEHVETVSVQRKQQENEKKYSFDRQKNK